MSLNTSNTEELLTVSQKDIKTLASYAGWTKLFAILNYISAGFLILVILFVTVVTLGIGLIFIGPIYGVLAWILIWSGKKLQQSGQAALELQEGDSLNTYHAKTTVLLSEIKTYFKIQGIMTIVSLILTALMVIFYIVAFGFIISNGVNSDKPFDSEFDFDSSSPSLFRDSDPMTTPTR